MTPVLVRQPMRDRARHVAGYTLHASFPQAEPSPDRWAATEAAYAGVRVADLTGGVPLLLGATPALLTGQVAAPDGPVVLAVPADDQDWPDLLGAMRTARSGGARLALTGFTGGPAQGDLLALVDQVVLDKADEALTAAARDAGVQVVVGGASTVAATVAAFESGADLVAGPLIELDAPVDRPGFSAAETHCLALLDCVARTPVDTDDAITIVATDPELSIRVLRLVNAASTGLRATVDSVPRAVVMVGPQQLRALAAASLAGAGRSNLHELWAMIARGLACWRLTGEEAGYTVGMLSAVAELRRVQPSLLARRAGLVGEVADALCFGAGQLGRAAQAVLRLEHDDVPSIHQLGWESERVAAAWYAALPQALEVASALSDEMLEHAG